jgi:DNA modification methylase
MNRIINSDCLEGLKELPDALVDCCVTSPPYFGLRDYGHEGQIGMEGTPEAFVDKMVEVFREVKRVLKPEGTLWVNLGDSYNGSGKGGNPTPGKQDTNRGTVGVKGCRKGYDSFKPKDLIGIPWMVAFALRADGWYLRQDIIWAKKNCLPESVTDRCTKSHEYIFMLSKSPRYFYDQDAIKEPAIYDVDGTGTRARKARQKDDAKSLPTAERAGIRQFKDAAKMNGKHQDKQRGHSRRHNGFNDRWDNMTHEEQCTGMRNKRDVWTISPAQYPEAHFATFPEEIPAICIKAGCPIDGLVLDPFMGAGTTALVARKLMRNFIGFELNPKYIKIAENRLLTELGMFK